MIDMQEKGIETFQRALPNGKVKQIFFFDPDGKLLLLHNILSSYIVMLN